MPLAYFAANSNVSAHWKHAEGMSLRYDAPAYRGLHKPSHLSCKRDSGIFIFALSDNLISEDWFFAEGEQYSSTGPRVDSTLCTYHQAALNRSAIFACMVFRMMQASPMPLASNFIFGGILHIFCTNWYFFTKNHYICKSKILNFIKILKP